MEVAGQDRKKRANQTLRTPPPTRKNERSSSMLTQRPPSAQQGHAIAIANIPRDISDNQTKRKKMPNKLKFSNAHSFLLKTAQSFTQCRFETKKATKNAKVKFADQWVDQGLPVPQSSLVRGGRKLVSWAVCVCVRFNCMLQGIYTTKVSLFFGSVVARCCESPPWIQQLEEPLNPRMVVVNR